MLNGAVVPERMPAAEHHCPLRGEAALIHIEPPGQNAHPPRWKTGEEIAREVPERLFDARHREVRCRVDPRQTDDDGSSRLFHMRITSNCSWCSESSGLKTRCTLMLRSISSKMGSFALWIEP